MSFRKNIQPFVQRELALAEAARRSGNPEQQFRHLENAHVLGQRSTWLHTWVHMKMWRWALGQRRMGELWGQSIRVIGALTKTAVGLVPEGNSGGANVSPFRPMPISAEHARIIARARAAGRR